MTIRAGPTNGVHSPTTRSVYDAAYRRYTELVEAVRAHFRSSAAPTPALADWNSEAEMGLEPRRL